VGQKERKIAMKRMRNGYREGNQPRLIVERKDAWMNYDKGTPTLQNGSPACSKKNVR